MDHLTDGPTVSRDPTPPEARAALRQRVLDRRRQMPDAMRSMADAAIGARLDAWLSGWRSRNASIATPVLGAWWPIRGEPSLLARLPTWHDAGWRIALPIVVARDAPLRFLQWTPGAEMVAGAMRVPQPRDGEPLVPDLLLVPCLGFDARGWRLGYGGGFYDRTLAARPVTAIGVAYDTDALSDFAPHPHDRRMDLIVTDACTVGAA